jgi:hypothetical protein
MDACCQWRRQAANRLTQRTFRTSYRSGRRPFSGDDPVKEPLAGQSLGTLLACRVHEDVRVDQDHE